MGTGAGYRATNAGSVTTSGAKVNGMLDVGNVVLTNTGIIDTGGEDCDGMEANAPDNLPRNEGRIRASGRDGDIDVAEESFRGAQGMKSSGVSDRVDYAGAIVTTGGSAPARVLRGRAARSTRIESACRLAWGANGPTVSVSACEQAVKSGRISTATAPTYS